MKKVEAGEICTGVVVSKTAFGIFIDVGAGKDALLHRSNLRGNNRNLREQRYEEIQAGDELMIEVIEVENGGRRIEVTEKAIFDDIAYSQLPLGEVLSGVVSNVKEYGAFVVLPQWHVSGLLHVTKCTGDSKEGREAYIRSLRSGDLVEICVEEIDHEAEELRVSFFQQS